MPGTVLRDVTLQHRLYLVARSSYVGVNVDGLACPCTILWFAVIRRGDTASCQALPCPVVLK
jgi:hypothetical protein